MAASYEVKDWFVMALFGGVWIASTVYLFKHPGDIAFGTWAGMVGSMSCAFHWMMIRDSKMPDAPGQ